MQRLLDNSPHPALQLGHSSHCDILHFSWTLLPEELGFSFLPVALNKTQLGPEMCPLPGQDFGGVSDPFDMSSFTCSFAIIWTFPPRSSVGKESACSTGDTAMQSLIPQWGRSPEGGNGNPLQYSCLENPMDRGAWQATVHRVGHKESDTTQRLNLHHPFPAKLDSICKNVHPAPTPLREALLSRLPWHEATQPNVFLKTCELPFLEIKKRELLVKGSEFSGLTVQMHVQRPLTLGSN